MILETERLILRPWEEKDAHDLFHIFGLCKKWKSWEIKSRASFGLSEKTIQANLIRKFIKFSPWQLGYMRTIHGVYSDFDLISIILSPLETLLVLLLLAMAIFRKEKRHLGYLLGHIQVQLEGDNK